MTANTPRAILERLALACFIALLIASMGLMGLGLVFGLPGGDARPAIFGVAGLLLALAVRPFGYKHLHFRKWADSFEPAGGGIFDLDPGRGERAQAFAEALAQLEALQRQIAAGDADVWTVQRLRHEIAAMLAADPGLRELFESELAAHPELA